MKQQAKPFQLKGAQVQKSEIAARVERRLLDLRTAILSGKVSGPFSKRFVLNWIAIDKHTLNRSYHAVSKDLVEAFLLESDVACGVERRIPSRKLQHSKRSMREEMLKLALDAEIVRLRLQCRIDDLSDRLRSRMQTRPGPENFRSIVRLDGDCIKPPERRKKSRDTAGGGPWRGP